MSAATAIERIGQIQASIDQFTGAGVFEPVQQPGHVQALTQARAEAFEAELAATEPSPPAPEPAPEAVAPEQATPAAGAQQPEASETAPTPAPVDGVTGADVVDRAKRYLGVPYVWGGSNLDDGGLDCSGLVQLVFGELGVDMPRVVAQQMHEGQEVESLDQVRPGDLIVTRDGGHILIAIGNGQALHAPRPGAQVEIRNIFETDADVTTIRRILPTEQEASATGSELLDALLAEQQAGADS